MPIKLHQIDQLMILYYFTKFHFIITNGFRVKSRGHSHPPPPPKPSHPQKAQAEKGLDYLLIRYRGITLERRAIWDKLNRSELGPRTVVTILLCKF